MITYRDKNGKVHEIEGDLFVTKDKNNEGVFAGDLLRSGKRIFTVIWEEENLQWKVREEGYTYLTPLCQWAISEQFELIEEKEDDGQRTTQSFGYE